MGWQEWRALVPGCPLLRSQHRDGTPMTVSYYDLRYKWVVFLLLTEFSGERLRSRKPCGDGLGARPWKYFYVGFNPSF